MGEAERKNVRGLTVFNAVRGAVVGGYMTIFPVYLRSLGYSMKSIGGIISLASVILALFLPYLGYLNDKYGPRKMIVASTLLLVAAPLMAAFTREFPLLALSYGLFLLSFLAGQPARMSFLAASVSPTRLGIAIGVTTGAFSASRTVGPALAGFLARSMGFRVSFELLATLGLISLVVFLVLTTPVTIKSRPRSPWEVYRSLIRPPRGFREVLAYVSMDRIAWSMWFPLVSAHLYSYGYTEDLVGLLVTGSGAVQTIVLPLAGKLTDRGPSWRVLATSDLLGVAVALLLINPLPIERAAAAMGFLGLSIALWIPAYNSLIARVAGGSGVSYASANTARSLFSAPFPYIGGRMYDALGAYAPFLASSTLMIATTIYAALVVAPIEAEALAEERGEISPPPPAPVVGARSAEARSGCDGS
ncbi:MAG: MFS transporter [Desulfurococcales archaeon]|nr:MFS transporter [Desulfurococcales archaeon]